MCIWKGQRETQLLLKKSGGTTEEVADGEVARLEEQLAGAFSGSTAVNPLATAPPTW